MDNYLPIDGIMGCLKDAFLQMMKKELFIDSDACEKLNNSIKIDKVHKSYTKRIQEAYYLRDIVQNVRFYKKQLNVLPKYNKNDKLVYEQIQKVVNTFETAKVNIYLYKYDLYILYKYSSTPATQQNNSFILIL